jgi:3-methylcrotonyl-CoA carboxylase alpha subunit
MREGFRHPDLIAWVKANRGRLVAACLTLGQAWIAAGDSAPHDLAYVLAALGLLLRERTPNARSPWASSDGWRLNSHCTRPLVLVYNAQDTRISIEYAGAELRVSINKATCVVSGLHAADGELLATIDGKLVHATVVEASGKHHIFCGGDHWVFTCDDPLDVDAGHHAKASSLRAPMPGRVIALMAQPGDRVERGEPLMVLEAMKMECTVHAPADGRVDAFYFAAGDQVTEGVELLRFDREDGKEK